MELRHLRYFRAVAEELHFGRAAEQLHISQPPLSQQIRQLEQELGVDLLARTSRKVETTPAGAAYLKRVVAILEAVEEAGEQAKRIANGVEGRLAIGCVGSATYSLLPRLARTLRKTLPNVDLNVRGEMLAPAQIAALQTGEIDLALLRPPVLHPELAVQTVRRERLLVALPDDHPLTAHETLEITDLRAEEFVAHAGQGRSVMSDLLATICAEAGFSPQIRHEVEETSTLVTLVAAGMGIAVVPDPTAAVTITGVSYRPLLPENLGVDLAVAYSATTQNPLIEKTLTALKNVLAHHTPQRLPQPPSA